MTATIHLERARRASDDAQKRLKGLPDTDPVLQQARLRRPTVRMRAAGKH